MLTPFADDIQAQNAAPADSQAAGMPGSAHTAGLKQTAHTAVCVQWLVNASRQQAEEQEGTRYEKKEF